MFLLNLKTMVQRNFKKKNKYLIRIISVFVALILASFLFNGFPPSFITKNILFLIQPFISYGNNLSDFVLHNYVVLKDKKGLERENIFLKQRVMELEIKESFAKVLEEENQRLRSVFSLEGKKSMFATTILSRPGYGIYSSLIINAGSKDGVKEGMPVTAFGDVLLGYVFDVSSDISRVKLVSFPDEETNVFVGNRISAIARGLGGENLEIELPNDINISTGDTVITLGNSPFFLGIVEKVIKNSSDSFQKIIFRLPVNIQELRYVYLVQ